MANSSSAFFQRSNWNGKVRIKYKKNFTLPNTSVNRIVAWPSFRGSAFWVAVCRNSPFQNTCSIVGNSRDALEPLSCGMLDSLKDEFEQETWCLLAGGSSKSSSSGAAAELELAWGRSRFWRSRRSFSSWALSDKNEDTIDWPGGWLVTWELPVDDRATSEAVEVDSVFEASSTCFNSSWKRASSISSSSLTRLIKSGFFDVSCKLNAIALC